jgi:trimethylamine--corrinoid protein Co-methyltransferase
MQAGNESALALSTGLLCGVHFVHQACGILGAYSAISFEKFVLDEEVCGLMKRALCPVDISEESIGLDLIERVGTGGNYMMTDETLMHCRTAFFPSCLAQRGTYEEWREKNLGDTARIAAKHVEERLETYLKPDNDPTMEKDIERYLATKFSRI